MMCVVRFVSIHPTGINHSLSSTIHLLLSLLSLDHFRSSSFLILTLCSYKSFHSLISLCASRIISNKLSIK